MFEQRGFTVCLSEGFAVRNGCNACSRVGMGDVAGGSPISVAGISQE